MVEDPDCINPELITLSREPLVAGVPLNLLNSPVMSNERFFVRSHFPIPKVDAADWSLAVSGEVENQLTIGYADLKELPRHEVLALLECAGNSRAAVQPPIEGLLWDHGGVGTSGWAGVSLSTILKRAGLRSTAKEVLLEGMDQGEERGTAGKVVEYAMSLPMEKALHPDTILAYEMNATTLPQSHGFPLRAIVPGWFGMTSVKWLKSIRVLDHAFVGFHQTSYYVFVQEGATRDAPPERVTSLRVKSLITNPVRGQYVPPGQRTIEGVAWSGNGPIEKVEVSTDNSQSWHRAEVNPSTSPYAWQQWTYAWDANKPGNYLIRARATDVKGDSQPTQFEWNFRGFANNAIHVVPVIVRPPQ